MFAQVVLSRRFPKSMGVFDYAIPSALQSSVQPGLLITVPFRSSSREGVIVRLSNASAYADRAKAIESIVDNQPVLTTQQLKLAQWMSEYYHVSIGTIVKTMLPLIPKRKHKTTDPQPVSPVSPALSANVEKRLAAIAAQSSSHAILYDSCDDHPGIIHTLLAKSDGAAMIIVPEIKHIPEIQRFVPQSRQPDVIHWHADMNKNQHHRAWSRIRNNANAIVIGTKHVLLTPVSNLSMILIDREESQHHVQTDQNPRFSAQQVAFQLQQLHAAALIAISSSPTVPTWHAAAAGSQYYLTAEKNSHLSVVDMREERKKKNYDIFSDTARDLLEQTLKNGKRVFVFINKRGSASAVQCKDCGHVLPCPTCATPLTYHATSERLYCHRCNHRAEVPPFCPSCGGVNFYFAGIGTQSVEREVVQQFPNSHTCRIDSDTDTETISDKCNVIVGTTKAFDIIPWDTVGATIVASADSYLHLPDYRSTERTWHVLRFIACKSPGSICVQTYSPTLHVFGHIARKADRWYDRELDTRKQLGYPPFSQLIKLIYIHKNKSTATQEAQRLYRQLVQTPLDVSLVTPLQPQLHGSWRWYVIIRRDPAVPAHIIDRVLDDVPDGWIIERDPYTLL